MLQKYRIHIVLTILTLILFSSCEKKVQYDPPTLDEETMVKMLKAIYVTEVKTLDTYELSIQKSRYLKNYVYPELFDSMKVDPAQFYQSYHFYDQQPIELTKLLDKVIAEIDAIQVDTSVVESDGKSLEKVYQEIHQIENLKESKKNPRRERNE